MNAVAVLALVCGLSLGWVLVLVWTAPLGYEDKRGFHFGEPERMTSSRALRSTGRVSENRGEESQTTCVPAPGLRIQPTWIGRAR